MWLQLHVSYPLQCKHLFALANPIDTTRHSPCQHNPLPKNLSFPHIPVPQSTHLRIHPYRLRFFLSTAAYLSNFRYSLWFLAQLQEQEVMMYIDGSISAVIGIILASRFGNLRHTFLLLVATIVPSPVIIDKTLAIPSLTSVLLRYSISIFEQTSSSRSFSFAHFRRYRD